MATGRVVDIQEHTRLKYSKVTTSSGSRTIKAIVMAQLTRRTTVTLDASRNRNHMAMLLVNRIRGRTETLLVRRTRNHMAMAGVNMIQIMRNKSLAGMVTHSTMQAAMPMDMVKTVIHKDMDNIKALANLEGRDTDSQMVTLSGLILLLLKDPDQAMDKRSIKRSDVMTLATSKDLDRASRSRVR